MKLAFGLEGRASMRPLSAALALALVLAPLGCNRKIVTSNLRSEVDMGDPQAQAQLVSGFYAIEEGAWRWTKRKFSVELAPPAGAAKRGAWLRVHVTAPDVLIGKLGAVTMSASVDGEPLSPETYSAAGAYTYEREIAARMLRGESVRVDFALDKAMPPAGRDLRELGIVALSAGLDPK
jgi:hypothetical protein